MGESVKRLSRRILLVVLAAAWSPGPAHAQWVIAPYLGMNVAGDVELGKGGPGVSAGYVGDRIGFEVDFIRYQHFFKDSRVSPLDPAAPPNCLAQGDPGGQPCVDINTDAISFMGNVLVPIGGARASTWRPYGAAGLGVIRGWTNERQIDRHQTDFGFNAGGGVIYSLGRHVGLRGDVRYFRVLVDEGASGNIYREGYGFLRAGFGVAFRFPG